MRRNEAGGSTEPASIPAFGPCGVCQSADKRNPGKVARITNDEREKRARLRAELESEMHRPLNEGVRLSPKERERIALKVRGGKMAQSLFPANAGVRRTE